jgi:hypothetical protein
MDSELTIEFQAVESAGESFDWLRKRVEILGFGGVKLNTVAWEGNWIERAPS